MSPDFLKKVLEEVQQGGKSVDKAMEDLKSLPFQDLGHTKVDHHRELRTGYPEVIFCQGKTVDQVVSIVKTMLEKDNNILCSRATKEMFDGIKEIFPGAVYHELARSVTIKQRQMESPDTYIAVVTAGTSDISVAEEAVITAEIFGNKVKRIYDVGVAGIHRLQGSYDEIAGARVIVVAAGMEGALPSVVGGLIARPVIAVPTSVGYGANFFGLAALLGMLTSCASGVSVVNIDNGFGAGYLASMINKIC